MSIDEPAAYAIRVQGVIGPEWVDRLGGLEVRQVTTGLQPMTDLVGHVADQTALAGVLSTLFDLGLPIVSVDRLVEPPPREVPVKGDQQ
jgi:hypothetical protein